LNPFADPLVLPSKHDLDINVKSVRVNIYDYGWLLKGKAGANFIEYLAG
jgi:hypothetical protein